MAARTAGIDRNKEITSLLPYVQRTQYWKFSGNQLISLVFMLSISSYIADPPLLGRLPSAARFVSDATQPSGTTAVFDMTSTVSRASRCLHLNPSKTGLIRFGSRVSAPVAGNRQWCHQASEWNAAAAFSIHCGKGQSVRYKTGVS